MPLMYEAAGLARKATAFATSDGFAIRRSGTQAIHSFSSSSRLIPLFFAIAGLSVSSLGVAVNPGSTLFTVIPNSPSSIERVLDQLATAPRMVLETPNPTMGAFTVVEMILLMRP